MPQEFAFDSGLGDLLLAEKDLTEGAIDETPPILPPSRNERKSRRHKVPQERQQCQVKVGTNVLPATLVNKSDHGFGVLLDSRNGLRVGQKVYLHTDLGWFAIRLVYIAEVARPEYVGTGASDCSPCVRLGCLRLGAGPLPGEPLASPLPRSLWARLTRRLFPFLDG